MCVLSVTSAQHKSWSEECVKKWDGTKAWRDVMIADNPFSGPVLRQTWALRHGRGCWVDEVLQCRDLSGVSLFELWILHVACWVKGVTGRSVTHKWAHTPGRWSEKHGVGFSIVLNFVRFLMLTFFVSNASKTEYLRLYVHDIVHH